jgi:hypothetical protein
MNAREAEEPSLVNGRRSPGYQAEKDDRYQKLFHETPLSKEIDASTKDVIFSQPGS